jgi:hypothetical protein
MESGGLIDDNMWQKMKTSWPEAFGYYPIEVYILQIPFFHFPKKDDYNLLYTLRGNTWDSLEKIVPQSFDSLADSKVILRYFKSQIPNMRIQNKISAGGYK